MKVAVLAVTLAVLVAAPVRASPVDRWHHHIEEAAARFGMPAIWIERVMRAESGGQTTLRGRPIVSHAGAMGLMQLMPGTWKDMRRELRLGNDPHDPRDNILAGTRYLRQMYDRFGYPGLFAAYNAGPARYAGYLAGRNGLPFETRAYVAALGAASSTRQNLHAPSDTRAIFFTLRSQVPKDTREAGRAGPFAQVSGDRTQ